MFDFQLEASRKQHEILCERLKAKKPSFTPSFLPTSGVGGSFHTSCTSHHLKELGLNTQRAHKTALKFHAHSAHYAHKLTTKRRVFEKSSCFQGLHLDQGAACHQILSSSFISLVEETRGCSGQCVSFSLINAGNFLPARGAHLIA